MSLRHSIPSLLLVISLAFTSCDSQSDTQAESKEEREARIKQSLAALTEKVQRQEELVQEKRKALVVLIQEYGIHGGPDSSPASVTEEEIFRRANMKLDVLEEQRDVLKLRIKHLRRVPDSITSTTTNTTFRNNHIRSLYHEHFKTVRERDHLKANGLGPNHPNLLALQNQVKSQLHKIKKDVADLHDVLKTKLSLVDRQIEHLREIVAGKVVDYRFSKSALAQHHYNTAKKEYEEARDLLQDLKRQQQETRTLLGLPNTPSTTSE